MSLKFVQAARQTKALNQSLVQAVNIMRMTGSELDGFLNDAAALNPFIDIENKSRSSVNGAVSSLDQPAREIADSRQISLYRHVANQLPYLFDTKHDLSIALGFLVELEPSGWLGTSVESIARKLGLDTDICIDILKRLQAVEPAGLFARGLKECLHLQAAERAQLDEVMIAVIDQLHLLMEQDTESFARRLGHQNNEVIQCLKHIRRMDPKPGSRFEYDESLLRESDVILTIEGQDLVIELNQSSFPSMRLIDDANPRRARTEHQKQLNTLLRDAKALKIALEMRKSTTMAVVTAIFLRQRAFLISGYVALAPMRLSDIADDIDMSEATISRVVAGLTIQCPQGNIEAKTLFCTAVTSSISTGTKHIALQAIKTLIDCENKSAPLSDGVIAGQLQETGIMVSRRTVAKYRHSIGFLAPRLRRKSAEIYTITQRRSAITYDL